MVSLIVLLLVIGAIAGLPFFIFRIKENTGAGDTRGKFGEFFQRQFSVETTYKQKRFDLIFGVVLPVICFAFDPIVFDNRWGWMAPQPLLGAYKPFAYLLSFAAIMGLLAFLLMGEKLKWANAFLGGLFFLSAAISLAIGVVLVPFSLLGLFLLFIGALGFTPLFSGFALARNAVRAYGTSGLDTRTLKYSAALGAILSFCIPFVAYATIQRELAVVETGDAQAVRDMGARLRYVAPLVNTSPLVMKYARSENTSEFNDALEEAFFDITGEGIAEKARMASFD